MNHFWVNDLKFDGHFDSLNYSSRISKFLPFKNEDKNKCLLSLTII